MKQSQNNKLYYKMYKKGRFWVFAGMAVVTMNMGMLTSHADDAAAQSSSEATTSSTSETSSISQSAVVLQSSSSTTDESSKSAATVESTKTATETTKAASTTTDETQPATDSETKKTTIPVESSSSSETKKSVAVTSTDHSKTQAVPASDSEIVTQPASTNTSEAKPDATVPVENDGKTDTAVGDTVVSSTNVTAPTDEIQLNQAEKLTNIKLATNNALGASAVQENKLSRSSLARAAVVESGNKLGLDYTITDDGVLTIQGGNLQDTSTGAGSPWVDDAWEITKVVIAGPIVASKNMSSLFDQLPNVTEFVGLDQIDTSAVTDMSYLFRGDTAVQNLDLSSWATKTGNVTNLDLAFYGTYQLKTLNLNNWDVSKVTSMQQTFDMGDWMTASAIEEIDVDNWNTTNVKGMSHLFADNKHLSKLDLSTWKHTENVTNMQNMFSGDAALTQLDVSGFNTSKVTMIGSMFQGVGVSALDVSNFDTSSVQSANSMFSNMQHVTKITFGQNFKLANAAVSELFYQDPVLASLDLSAFVIPNTMQNYWMFQGDTSLKKITLGSNVNLNQVELNPGQPQPIVDLPEITATAQYTGKWVDESNQSGPAYTSAELTKLYDGTNGPDNVTYVWQVFSQSKLTAKDSVSLVAGPNTTWSPKDSVTEILDENGQPVDLTTADSLVKISSVNGDPAGIVDTNKPGTYTVELAYTDAAGTTQTATTTVVVTASPANLIGKNVSINMGTNATWNRSDAVDRAASVDGDGQALTDDELRSVTDSGVDLTKAGEQTVTLSYVDQYGNQVSTEITVTVVASKAKLTVKPITVVAGPEANWSLLDSLLSVTDFAGQSVAPADFANLAITIDKQPDLLTLGNQLVTITYTDDEGNVQTYTTTVTVVASQAGVNVKNSSIQVGDNWTAADNFVSATDANGNALELKDVQVDGTVDTTTAGTYPITYHYTDAAGNVITATTNVTVTAATKPDTGDNGSTDSGDQIDPEQPAKPTTPTTPTTKPTVKPVDPVAQPNQVTATGDKVQTASAQPVALNTVTPAKGHLAAVAKSTPAEAKLPQTDETATTTTSVLGLSLLTLTGLMSLVGLGRKRRHN